MRLAERKGSSAVAKAIIVKSGMRKKTIDLLTAFFGVIQTSPLTSRPCRDQQSVIRKTLFCQWHVAAERDKFHRSSGFCSIRKPPRGQAAGTAVTEMATGLRQLTIKPRREAASAPVW